MRRTPGASASRRYGRVCAIPLIAGMLLATPGLAVAQPGSPDSLGSLVAAVADVNQKLQDLGAAIQAQQEGVNKAIVDVQAARDNAAAAQRELDASGQRVEDANTAITAAQDRFDTFAVATYVNGPSSSYLTASDPSDILNTAATGQMLAVSTQQVISDLQRARTEQVNKESAARLAKQNADQAVIDAEASQQTAVSALTDAQQTFGAQQAELDKLTAERAASQAKLDQARAWSAPVAGQPAARPAAAATPARPRGQLGSRPRRAGTCGGQVGHGTVGSDPARHSQRLRQRRSDRDHQHDPRLRRDVGAGHPGPRAQLPAEDGPVAHPDRLHQRRDSPRLRQAGHRVRDSARHGAAWRAVLVGRR